ncbi:MAG: exonuclease domain-containing protein [Bacteroidales bacterium]
MDFITIDFETASNKYASPCEIGLTFVKNDRIIGTKSWLIRPLNNEYSWYNIKIHGIQPEETENEPEFDQIWEEIQPLVENQFLIAHNAAFDMRILRNTLELYHLPFPTLDYSCSCIFSKTVWPDIPSYGLAPLCEMNHITFKHHRAGDDSEATAKLILIAFKKAGIKSINDFPEKLNTEIGHIFKGGYHPSKKCHAIRKTKKTTKITKADANAVEVKDLVLKDIIQYYAKKDISQLDHTIKVAYFTRAIAEKEKYTDKEIETLEIAALLHDIGCPNSQEKYSNTLPDNQEKEGMIVAQQILTNDYYSKVPNKIKADIIYMVGHHHQKPKAIEFKFMPLFEADAIVNMTEGYFKSTAIARKLIDSKTGLEIFDNMF